MKPLCTIIISSHSVVIELTLLVSKQICLYVCKSLVYLLYVFRIFTRYQIKALYKSFFQTIYQVWITGTKFANSSLNDISILVYKFFLLQLLQIKAKSFRQILEESLLRIFSSCEHITETHSRFMIKLASMFCIIIQPNVETNKGFDSLNKVGISNGKFFTEIYETTILVKETEFHTIHSKFLNFKVCRMFLQEVKEFHIYLRNIGTS